MTRKDYVRFAAMFKSIYTNKAHYSFEERMQTALISRLTADIFADNPRFDRAKFLKACGVKS